MKSFACIWKKNSATVKKMLHAQHGGRGFGGIPGRKRRAHRGWGWVTGTHNAVAHGSPRWASSLGPFLQKFLPNTLKFFHEKFFLLPTKHSPNKNLTCIEY